jgi:hypothetical protein
VKDEKVAGFLAWAKEHLAGLYGADGEEATDRIHGQLEAVDEALGCEVSQPGDEPRELIVTAFSDATRFDLVREIVAGLHGVSPWKVIALKPPRGWTFAMTLGNTRLAAGKLRWTSVSGVRGGVRLIPSVTLPLIDEEQAEELAWLIVETGLGEELSARLKHVEFGVGTGRPIEELDAWAREQAS